METGSKPKKRRTLLKRIFPWVVLLLLGIYVLFCIWFYLFQESVLLRPDTELTGQMSKPSLNPSVDILLEPPEAKIKIQKFDAPTDSPKGTVFYLHGILPWGLLSPCQIADLADMPPKATLQRVGHATPTAWLGQGPFAGHPVVDRATALLVVTNRRTSRTTP